MSTDPKALIQELLDRLHDLYPEPECALHHKNAFELLAATILSAQCTDKRVNLVTPALFARFPTPQAMMMGSQEELETLIHSTGFFRNKAKSLIGMSQKIVFDHAGEVPNTLEALIQLPGVARKTANVVLGVIFKKAVGVVVDTHVGRLSQRLGLTHQTHPVKIERDLMHLLPQKEWIAWSHRLIMLGREVCSSRSPKCDSCPLNDLCPSAFQA